MSSLVPGEVATNETLGVTCWYLWWNRRKTMHGEKVQQPYRSAMSLAAMTANFRASYSARPKKESITWLKPPRDHVKVNVDASFDEDSLRGTIEAVARDAAENFIAASNSKHALKKRILLAQTGDVTKLSWILIP
ncbi:hypothetical protein QYE76_013312 [Lolium multiflorum]|uniref:Uncharacterized protein n=1 Tax=Lolium multiflorum TaxID=4521 RepID=A0AAD8U2U5_LOLMU|nr:hypothetical protein QYE76_013312 [Lolium multiflorum]